MIEVWTRSMSDVLYNKMRALIPLHIPCYQVKGFNKSEDCATFLHYVIKNSKDIAVTVDDDCFITDWDAIESMINTLSIFDVQMIGVNDGGVIDVRKRSFVVFNPFFQILDTKAIREKYTTEEEIDNTPPPSSVELEEYAKRRGYKDNSYNHSLISPYNGFYNWMWKNFNHLSLRVETDEDGVSTVIPSRQSPILYHSWWSREYDNDIKQRQRIDKLHIKALEWID